MGNPIPIGLENAEVVAALNKAHNDYTAAEIDTALAGKSDIVILTPLQKVQQLLISASNKEKIINYIVTGDSTRENTYNEMNQYYVGQFAKINVTVDYDSDSGNSARNWLLQDVTSSPTSSITHALSLVSGTGESSILEFSMGLNDLTVSASGSTDPAVVKQRIKDSILALLSNRPDLTIVLVTPVYTANSTYNVQLQTMYYELAAEHNLHLVDVLDIMGLVHGNTDFYQDSVHPNKYGSRRLLNVIMDSLIPSSISHLVSLEEVPAPLIPSVITELATRPINSSNLVAGISSGYWQNADGSPTALSTWRRFDEISVIPAETLNITHQGDQFNCIFMDAVGDFIEGIPSSTTSSQYRSVLVPANAATARINLSSDGATYDASSDVPTIFYNNPAMLHGYWQNASGAYTTYELWRSLAEISIEPNFVLKIQHQGDLHTAIFMDAEGSYISYKLTEIVSGELYRTVTIPPGSAKVRINVSTDSVFYDSLGDAPSVKYLVPPITTIPTVNDINEGVSISLPNFISNEILVSSKLNSSDFDSDKIAQDGRLDALESAVLALQNP